MESADFPKRALLKKGWQWCKETRTKLEILKGSYKKKKRYSEKEIKLCENNPGAFIGSACIEQSDVTIRLLRIASWHDARKKTHTVVRRAICLALARLHSKEDTRPAADLLGDDDVMLQTYIRIGKRWTDICALCLQAAKTDNDWANYSGVIWLLVNGAT